MERIYLDWAATALPDEKIIKEAAEASVRDFGNPSSPHKRGKDAATFAAGCKHDAADILGTTADRLYLTGGGTESNNIVLFSLLTRKRTGNIVISGIEHSAVYEPARVLEKFGWELRIVNPEPGGLISPERFCSRIDGDTRMAAVIMVNNETGAVQPVEEIGRRISEHDERRLVHFHVDAVQAAGKYPLSLDGLPVDSAAISSHKFRGPRGTGLLYLRKDITPLYAGGGQERGIRHGTENILGLAGTSAALRTASDHMERNLEHALALKRILVERISAIPGVSFNSGSPAQLLDQRLYSPWILSVSVKPVPGEILVRVMSDRGFDIATGSACATGKKKKSRVMTAMGIEPDDAFSTVRISTGPDTSVEEINRFCDIFERESNILIKTLVR